MEIVQHRLQGITQNDTPNKGGLLEPLYLIFHYTSGRSAQESIDWLCNPEAKASAHLVVARDGSITQLVSFNTVAWHAGVSQWGGHIGLNKCSIGIEMDNAGRLTKVGDTYRAWFQSEYKAEDVVLATHKLEHVPAYWHAYTAEQIKTAQDLALLLAKTYGLKDILGHDDIAPGRKSDPGPAFPLANIRSKVVGRVEDNALTYEVIADTLNIRKGPGIEYEPAAAPLVKGTKVVLLEQNDRWSKVDVVGNNDIEGWVNNKFLVEAAL
jgi:N-acetylmuramoyl-L-alanine amidase